MLQHLPPTFLRAVQAAVQYMVDTGGPKVSCKLDVPATSEAL